MSEYMVKLKSVYLNDIAEINIVMPNPPMNRDPEEFYRSGKKFKVLWLLHGGRDTYRDWFSFSNVVRTALQYGIMLVMPNGHDSDFVNHPEMGDGYLFHDFFFRELMPYIYNWFPASEKQEDNLLAGNSMGCAATWQYGLQHPEKFGYIAPLSNQPLDYRYLEPYRDMSGAEFRAKALADKNAFAPAYGLPDEGIHIKEVNTISKYATVGEFLDSYENTMARFEDAVKTGRLPKVYIPGGTEPRDRKLLEFKKHVEELGLSGFTFSITDENTHCFAFWEKAVRDFLDFAGVKKIDYYIGV